MITVVRIRFCVLIIDVAAFSAMAVGFATADTPVIQPAPPDETPPAEMAQSPHQDNIPLLVVERSNSCEIVSCGMGLKDTCKITCPSGKTPKCSCDCAKSFGPMCTEYKANCRCE